MGDERPAGVSMVRPKFVILAPQPPRPVVCEKPVVRTSDSEKSTSPGCSRVRGPSSMAHVLTERMVKNKHRRPLPHLAKLEPHTELRTVVHTDRLPTLSTSPDAAVSPVLAVVSPAQPAGNRFVQPAVNSDIPALEDWAGGYDFAVTVRTPPPAAHGRQQPYVYDVETKKLYVDMMIAVPFSFSVAGGVDTSRLRVSALPVFAEMHHVNNPVRRCATHLQTDHQHNVGAEAFLHHVIRAEQRNASYRSTGSTGERRSVVVPFEQPQPGTREYTVLYKFCCMNTCVGGINRRRLVVVFTLEDRCTGETLGRRKIEVKVCKCPHRDFRADQHRRHSGQTTTDAPATKRRREPSPPGGPRRRRSPGLVIVADDEAMYDHLIAVRNSLRLYRMRVDALATAAAVEDPVEDVQGEAKPAGLGRHPSPIKLERVDD